MWGRAAGSGDLTGVHSLFSSLGQPSLAVPNICPQYRTFDWLVHLSNVAPYTVGATQLPLFMLGVKCLQPIFITYLAVADHDCQ